MSSVYRYDAPDALLPLLVEGRPTAIGLAMPPPPVVPRVETEIAAKLFRGFADPTRLSILLVLLEGEHRVVDLVDRVGGSQANVSGHLACLKECGLVEGRPDGRAVRYRIAQPEVVELLRSAEELLGATGTAIELCDNYDEEAAR